MSWIEKMFPGARKKNIKKRHVGTVPQQPETKPTFAQVPGLTWTREEGFVQERKVPRTQTSYTKDHPMRITFRHHLDKPKD
jgi:hypothetical protein